jgi:DnaK suppressor protein
MNKKTIEQFKKRLTDEKLELENELNNIGQKSEKTPGGWEATASGSSTDSADENEVADKLEELEENTGIVNQLETQLGEVNLALERIEKGTYGICDKCGKPIEVDRLEANPSSRFSIKHGH